MDLARTLIDSMTDTFDPAKYKDDYHDKVLAVIQAKVAGRCAAGGRRSLPRPQARLSISWKFSNRVWPRLRKRNP